MWTNQGIRACEVHDSENVQAQVAGEEVPGRESSKCKGPKLGRILRIQ